MTRWPDFVFRHQHAVVALLLAVVILGIQARFELPVQLFPDTDPPTVSVITAYPGMAAVDVDSDLTRLLEEEFAGLDELRRISSTSQTGLSVVRMEFAYGRDAALAGVEVQNAISRIRQDLPRGMGEPQVLEFSTADKPIVTAALESDTLSLEEVRELADNAVRERLERIPGVAAVDIFGGAKRELHIALKRDQLEALGLDAVRARFRPIMMTSLSTIMGMLPLALEVAVGAERFSPIATVIIGGVSASTVLTLIVVPTLFVALERDSGGVK